MATDWTALKLEYVNSSVTLRELADRHGIKAAGVMRRAAKEQWEAERKQESAKVSKASQAILVEDRAAELARFNQADLAMAWLAKQKAEEMISGVTSPADLKSLVTAVEAAQRVGRLALGASTDNATVTTKELPASVDEFV